MHPCSKPQPYLLLPFSPSRTTISWMPPLLLSPSHKHQRRSTPSPPIPSPWTPPPLPSKFFSILSIKIHCLRSDKSVLLLHVSPRHRSPGILRIMLQQHHGAAALHGGHPGVPCHLPNPQQHLVDRRRRRSCTACDHLRRGSGAAPLITSTIVDVVCHHLHLRLLPTLMFSCDACTD